MGVAEWNGALTARSMKWRFDGDVYSLTGLTKRVLQEAGIDPPDAIPGPDFWLLPNGTALPGGGGTARRKWHDGELSRYFAVPSAAGSRTGMRTVGARYTVASTRKIGPRRSSFCPECAEREFGEDAR